MTLPAPTERRCHECPFARDAAPGWLGPFTAEEWADLLVSDEPIACHITIHTDDSWEPPTRQCRGAGQLRRNQAKRPRDPEVYVADSVTNEVFGNVYQFVNHHEGLADE